MGKRAGSAVFAVAPADAAVLLGDLRPDEPSPLYAQLFKRLTADGRIHVTTEFRMTEDDADAFRNWLDRAKVRHDRNGDSKKAQAFARVRRTEH
jgi:hypothetical protein